MQVRTVLRGLVVTTVLAVLAALLPQMASAGPKGASGRYLVVARSSADYGALRAKAVREGARVLRDLPQANTLVVNAPASARSSLAADRRVLGVARDGRRQLTSERRTPNLSAPGLRGANLLKARAPAATTAAGINPDPAWDYKGLLWDYRRIGLPSGWKTTAGSPKVNVGVADTGLDFTHVELKPKVKRVIDFTGLEDPPVCKTFFGLSDADLAARFGGPEKTDWNGHGSWIGGRIAAALNGTGINGIAPKVNLVALKISQWCGSTWDSTILAAFVTAADLGLDIVSVSFGGYSDLTDPDQAAIYQAYLDAVRYARGKGTTIVASAGNEHVRVGAGGRVISHGQLSTPGDTAEDWPDLFGQFETPGGVPGVVDVSSTGRLVVPSSATCPPGTIGDPGDPDADPPVAPNFNATCKPITDRHQAAGQGRRNQLAYYSNYGPRIDLAGPGGARNATRALSATDTSPGDLTGLPCDIGYCHLGGPRITDDDAYGAGLVNVSRP
jgi:Subtilase family